MLLFRIFLTPLFVLLTAQILTAQSKNFSSCLPEDIKPETIVSAEMAEKPELVKKVYVKDELKRLKAKCVGKKLVDGKKREIKFFRLVGCWGNPPEDGNEILAENRRELAELRKKFTVITLTCNDSGFPIP